MNLRNAALPFFYMPVRFLSLCLTIISLSDNFQWIFDDLKWTSNSDSVPSKTQNSYGLIHQILNEKSNSIYLIQEKQIYKIFASKQSHSLSKLVSFSFQKTPYLITIYPAGVCVKIIRFHPLKVNNSFSSESKLGEANSVNEQPKRK